MFAFRDVIQSQDENCIPYDEFSDTFFVKSSVLATAIIWIIAIVFNIKGLRLYTYSSIVVASLVMVLILVHTIRGFTLSGAGTGINDYFAGSKETTPSFFSSSPWVGAFV